MVSTKCRLPAWPRHDRGAPVGDRPTAWDNARDAALAGRLMKAKSWIRVLWGSPTTPGWQDNHRTQHPSITCHRLKMTFDFLTKE